MFFALSQQERFGKIQGKIRDKGKPSVSPFGK